MNRYEPRIRELNAIPMGFERGLQAIHVSEVEIQEAERLLGGRLPEDYREFVRDFSAFQVPQVIYTVPPNIYGFESGVVNHFYGIVAGNGQTADFVQGYLTTKQQMEEWPEEWIFIGGGDSTNVALDFKGKTKGSVYTWQMFQPALVTDSFDEFMQLIQPHFGPTQRQIERALSFWTNFSTD